MTLVEKIVWVFIYINLSRDLTSHRSPDERVHEFGSNGIVKNSVWQVCV